MSKRFGENLHKGRLKVLEFVKPLFKNYFVRLSGPRVVSFGIVGGYNA